MKLRHIITSLAGATGLALTLAFAPVTMAQTPSDSATSALQQGRGNRGTMGTGTCDAANFVDKDGDGVCDNQGTGTCTGTGTKQQPRRGRP